MNYSFIIKNKRIVLSENERAVADNTDYTASFTFDAEWGGMTKTARFISGKYYTDVILSNDACTIPRLCAGTVYVGVYAGNLHTTTIAVIDVDSSVLTNAGTPAAPNTDVYTQILSAYDSKQDELTAGGNITIDNENVISAVFPIASSAPGIVKPVSKTDDMTVSVGVDGNGALYTGGEVAPSVISALSAAACKLRAYQSPTTLTLSLTSDCHYDGTDTAMLAGAKNMGLFKQYAPVNAAGNLGDLTPGDKALTVTGDCIAKLISAMNTYMKTPLLLCRGNHDDNGWYSYDGHGGSLQTTQVMNGEEWCRQAFNFTASDITIDPDNPTGGYGYWDHAASKIRVFVLNTEDIPYIADGTAYRYNSYGCLHAFSSAQLNFVASALEFSDKTVPNDWAALFLMHVPMDTTNTIGYRFGISDALIRGVEVMLAVIQAYKNGTSFSYSGSVYNASLGDQSADFNVSVSCDYSTKGCGDVVGFVCGHTHTDNISREVGSAVSLSRGYLYIGLIGNKGFVNLVFDRKNSRVCAVKYGTAIPDTTGAVVGIPDSGSVSSGEWTAYYSQFRPNEQNLYRGLDPDGAGCTFGSSDTALNLATLLVNSRDAYAAYRLTKAIPVDTSTTYKLPSDFVGVVCAYTNTGSRSAFLTVTSANGYKTITTSASQHYLVLTFHSTYAGYEAFTLYPETADAPNLFGGFDSSGAGYTFGTDDTTLNLSTLELNGKSASANYYLTKAIPVKPLTKYAIQSSFNGLVAAYGDSGTKSAYLTPAAGSDYKILTTGIRQFYLVFSFHTPSYSGYGDFKIKELCSGLEL